MLQRWRWIENTHAQIKRLQQWSQSFGISHGARKHLASECERALTIKERFIGDTFKPRLSISDKEREVMSWTELTTDERSSLRTVEKQSCRKCRKNSNNFSVKMLRDIILMMVELVEKKIVFFMKEVEQGSMLHDGWSKSGAHRAGLFACFIKKTLGRKEKEKSFAKMMSCLFCLLSRL